MKMKWKKIEVGVCVLLAIFLVSLTISNIFSSFQEIEEEVIKERIGETDVYAEFTRNLEIFTDKEHLFKINFENTGEHDLRYLTSLKLTGVDGVQVSSWRDSFVIKADDDYEFTYVLKGLEPGRYTLDLTIEADFFSSSELIEDVMRLGILGFLPKLEELIPILPGMLPFIVEMILYLLSDLWPPVIERGLGLVGDLDVVIAEIAYALAREWDTLAIAITDLLAEIIVDLPESMVEWVKFTPELVKSFEPILLEAPLYMLDNFGDFFFGGYSPIIKLLPLVLDGVLSFCAMLRYFGPFAAAALYGLLPGVINESENMTLFEFVLVGAGFLAGGGLIWLLLTGLGLATPGYMVYRMIYPVLDKMFYAIYVLLSPIIDTLAVLVSGITGATLGNLYGMFAPPIIGLIWSILVPVLGAAFGILGKVLDSLSPLFKIWEIPVEWMVTIQTPGIVSSLSKPLAPLFKEVSDALWRVGAALQPLDYGAMKGEAQFSIEVEVRDLTFIEAAILRLQDIWDTTVGTIGEYWG